MLGTKDYAKNSKSNMTTMGEFIKRYQAIYLTILLLIAALELGMMIYMSIRLSQKFSTYSVIYLGCYIALFTAAIATAIVVAASKALDISSFHISVLLHVFVVVIVAWATTISVVDVIKGDYPIVFLTIIITVGSIVFLDPIFYTILGALSSAAIFATTAITQPHNSVGYYFNIVVFIVMAVVVAYRNYSVSLTEERNKKHFQKLSEYDALTGLKNENSYYKLVDTLCNKIKNGDNVNFAVTLMDVNLLKSTNDKFGHQYGAHLIKLAGQVIGKIFSASHVFHVGGDEFVVISISDHKKVDEYIAKFDEELHCKPITYKGNDLILSVARGSATYKSGDQYADVLERADKAMYKYKKEMKKELGFPER